jgi:hypothetical protein
MTSPAVSPTAPGRLAKTGRPLETPLGCWARRAQDRELVAVAVRPSPVWARRHRRGDGVGDSPECGNVRTRVRRRARGSAHAKGKHHG